jgi:hypothetical protein
MSSFGTVLSLRALRTGDLEVRHFFIFGPVDQSRCSGCQRQYATAHLPIATWSFRGTVREGQRLTLVLSAGYASGSCDRGHLQMMNILIAAVRKMTPTVILNPWWLYSAPYLISLPFSLNECWNPDKSRFKITSSWHLTPNATLNTPNNYSGRWPNLTNLALQHP